VKFHNGKELDSGDVKYSMERVMNPTTKSPRRAAYKWVDSVDVIDKYHVKIKLKKPFAPFLTTLTIRNCPIIPANSIPKSGKAVPGTGPFMLKSFVPNESSEFTRFDQYWEYDEKTGDRLPYLDGIYIKKIKDPTVRWAAVRAGDVDYVNAIPRNVAHKEAKNPTPGTNTIIAKPVGFIRMVFNVTKPPFDNKKLRQAITYAIDKKELIEAAWWGLGVPLNNQAFPYGSQYYLPMEARKINIEKAKQMLAEAGYPNGLKVEFLQYSASSAYPVCRAVIGQLRKIGIEGSMKVLDKAAVLVAIRKGKYGMNVLARSERLDPDDAYYLLWHSSQAGKNNVSRYSNKEVDALLEEGRTTWQWEERAKIYKKVLEIINEDVPTFFLGKQISAIATRDFVKGRIAGMSTWLGYHQGGLKTAWFDK
jgi:peptide/nickel transport system substrate-binding protein